MQNKKLLFQIPLLALGVLVLFSFGFNTATAADTSSIYVSTHGNDTWDGQSATYNSTTGSGPKATINNATGTVAANGTVYIANGTYNESGININTNMTIIGESQKNTLINGTNNYGNPIFRITSGVNVNISNLTLTGNYGAIWNDGTLTVNNCNFTGNSAFNGGAINNNGGLTVDNCTFTGNTATYGGAIYNEGNLRVESSTFTGNTATCYGGAIYSHIYTENGTEPVTELRDNCTFTGNTAIYGGAIYSYIYTENGTEPVTTTMNNNSFINNSAINGNGGAIYNDIYSSHGTGAVTTTMNNNSFTGNNATYSGGAIYNWIDIENGTGALQVTMDNNSFTGNNAPYNGGAIFSEIDSYYGTEITVTANNNSFMNNSAVNGNGGAIYNDIYSSHGTGALQVTMNNSSFTGNTSNDKGGAIYSYICTENGTEPVTTMNNCNFTSNNATSTGGAIYTTRTLTVHNSSFTGNSAEYGGAIYNDGTLAVDNCNFTGNTATFKGGAIYSYINSYGSETLSLTMNNCTFKDNSAQAGGAIFSAIVNGGGTVLLTLSIDNCTFTGNNATDSSGAIYYSYFSYSKTEPQTLTVRGSIFKGNKAGNYGGAFFNEGGAVRVDNCTFENNSAYEGGAIYNDDGTLAVSNSTFTGNSASYNGGAIFSDIEQGNGGTLKVDNSTLTGNNATDGFGGAIYSHDSLNNVAVNFNRIVGNGPNEIYSDTGTLNATLNWWGSNADPSVYVSGVNGGSVNVTPWMVLNITADPLSINCGGNSTITTDLQHDSGILSDPSNPELYYHDPAAGHVPDVHVTFTATNGTIDPVPGALVLGNATTMFTAAHGGTGNVTATVDNQPVSALITINPISTVLIVGNATVVDGQNATLNATLTDVNGNPLGQQPVTFNVNGTGYPAVTGADGVATVQYPSSHAGTYPVTVSYLGTADYAASNGIGTLTVNPASYLYMNVTTSNGNPVVGQTFVVTYKLSNNGPDNATNVVITLQVPEGLEFVTANVDNGTWTYNAANRTVTWTLTNVPVGDPFLNITMESLIIGTQTINSPSLTSETLNINTQNMPTLNINTRAQQNNNNGGSVGNITNGSNTVNAATHEVVMQKTGAPFAELVLAILAVLGGVLVPRRK